jgi:Lipopolysaccharide biosynthesis proteins, LPS:glycosyltransferases
MKQQLNVLYQFDNNYAPYAGISILSLCENNKDIETLNIYCAITDVNEENISLLNATARKYNRNIIYMDTRKSLEQIHKIDAKTWNGSLATWFKIFIIEELIGKIDSLLYIDSDTLVVGNLRDLCNFDFDGKAIACIVDALAFSSLKRLNLENNQYYFNAGIMFFNLLYFKRHNNFYNDMINHLRRNIDRYSMNDQDLLNDFFSDNIKKMSPKYNFQGVHFMYSDDIYYKVYGKYKYYFRSEIANARVDVRIVHFIRVLGDYPWEKGNFHPLRQEYLKWKNNSLWKDIPDKDKKRNILFKIERIIYLCFPKALFLRLLKYITECIE